MSRKATRRAERATSLRRRILAGATTLVIGLGLAVGGLAPATASGGNGSNDSDKSNSTSYWLKQYPNADSCYKHEGRDMSNAHGTRTNGKKAITLNEFGSSWPGDRWEVLIVKAGSTGGTDGKGNAVYELPDAGVAYFAPNNKEVSHWIVCKGTTPADDKGYDLACDTITVSYGRALVNGDHITMDVYLNGSETKTRIHAYVDGNLGGYQNLGIRVNGFGSFPLTESEVKSGTITFGYTEYFTATSWAVSWVQMNDMHFNQDEQGEWFRCGELEDVTPAATATDDNCLEGVGSITFTEVDGIESYSVEDFATIFAPGDTLSGLDPGTYSVTAVPSAGFELADGSAPFDVVVGSTSEDCGVATASVTLPDPDCESGQSWDDAEFATSNASFGPVSINGVEYVVVATADEGYLFEGGETTKTFTISLLPADETECAEASAAVATTDPSCFSGATLDESKFTVSDGVTWAVVDNGATDGSFEVLFTAPSGSRFSNGESTLTATGTLAPVLGDEDCVFPVTNVFLAFDDATCLDPQSLDVDEFDFVAELAQLEGEPVIDSEGNYTVVFTAKGVNTTFDQSEDVAMEGRVVSNGGKTLTFTGQLDGPNEELCEQLPVIDPFEYVDTCLTATYTLYFVEGLTYWVTVNEDEPFEVVFGENEVSKTFAANPGDYVLVTPVANPGYVLDPSQPAPLDRTFNTYPDGCQLPELANWPASATATDEVCTPFGVTSGSITVQISTGPDDNPVPVRYYLAYETAEQQELTNETTTLPDGDYVVTAVLTDPEDSLNDSGNDPVSFPLTIGAADESDCDLPTLAITGANNAVTGVGIGAVIIILAGLGFVLRRQLVE